eukprot:3036139-Ditylum_brightwellii.AAC.1
MELLISQTMLDYINGKVWVVLEIKSLGGCVYIRSNIKPSVVSNIADAQGKWSLSENLAAMILVEMPSHKSK